MKIKTEYIVLAVIIVCLSLYLIFQNTDEVEYRLPDIQEINKKGISKIEIKSGPDEALVIHKENNTWLIAPKDYPADSGKVDSMLDVIDELSLTALVSEAENYGRYGLGDDKKIHVKAWAENELVRSFDIGKAASTFRHTFVRIAEDKRVYHAQENFRSKFDISTDKLRDKTVLSFNETEIQALSMVDEEKTLTLALTELPVEVSAPSEDQKEEKTSSETKPVWQDQDGNRVEKAKVDQLLATLSTLSCESYIKGKEKKDYQDQKPLHTVTLNGADEYSLTIFNKMDNDDSAYPAISSHNKYPFMLAGFRAEKIMKGLADDTD